MSDPDADSPVTLDDIRGAAGMTISAPYSPAHRAFLEQYMAAPPTYAMVSRGYRLVPAPLPRLRPRRVGESRREHAWHRRQVTAARRRARRARRRLEAPAMISRPVVTHLERVYVELVEVDGLIRFSVQ